MSKIEVELKAPTPTVWLETVLSAFDTFLADHANCERKASALAMGMVAKYPDRPAILPGLISVAREELEHFEAVYKVMCQRGIPLSRDTQDPYVNQLIDEMRHGRDERLLDRLVVAALVEMRGAERFGLIASALEDPDLQPFYERLYKSERKHGHVFMHFARQCFDDDLVQSRANHFAALEGDIMSSLPIRPALH